jgi:hypothetical protein
MPSLQEEFARAISGGLVTCSLTTCSNWAARRRVMGEPFPGPFTWKYHPWVKELHDSWAPFTYVMKAAQLGVTEAAINRALFTIDVLSPSTQLLSGAPCTLRGAGVFVIIGGGDLCRGTQFSNTLRNGGSRGNYRTIS